MPKKVCPNGHIYDSSIYGEECPLCPKGGNIAGGNTGVPSQQPVGHTGIDVPSPAFQPQPAPAPAPAPARPAAPAPEASGETQLRPGLKPAAPKPAASHATVIRAPKGAPAPTGRKLVGFLVTYSRNPQGKAFNIYEGKNFIGRDRQNDVAVPEDNQMSGRHMSILYRNVDNRFKFRDEQSSNGTFINEELLDEGELQNYAQIRCGGTVFTFIAIPQNR